MRSHLSPVADGSRAWLLKLGAGLLLGLALAATAATTAAGQTRGVAAAGRGIAEKWCSSCHLVFEGQARANVDVPTFPTIAKRIATDADFLAAFIANPHPPMPNMGLSRQDIADVLAFIATLK
ncbi:MAG: cytochrome c [Bauldia sp.]